MNWMSVSMRRPGATPAFLALRASLMLILVLGLHLRPAWGQEDVWVPEIPLTRDTGVHARALGMGGAYLAVSDDWAALRYNPAGLARVQRIEFTGSLLDRALETENDFHGQRQSADLSRAHVTGLGFVYPFPTYRGSMVIGLGYSVPWILDRDYRREGSWAGETLRESIFEEGTVGEWSFGYAVDVSPAMSLGFRASWIRGARLQDWVFEREGPEADDAIAIHDINDIDLSGYTGSLGALTRIGRWGRMGLVIDLPRWIHMDGTLKAFGEGVEYGIEESMTLPFSAGVGLAAVHRRLLLAADARFTDWTQIDYEGPLRYSDGNDRLLAYRRTWNLHLGIEYLLDLGRTAGLRLRAGYAREPVPYAVLFEDVTLGDSIEPIYERARFDPDRDAFTLGIGFLIEESVTVDAAYVAGGFSRSGRDLVEEETEQRLLLTAAFRLQ